MCNVIPRIVSVTGINEWREGELRSLNDYLVGEEPLEIRIGEDAFNVTMRTPGHELELVAGFLFTEGLISCRSQIASLGFEANGKQNGANRVRADLAPGVTLNFEAARRSSYTTSSCGVCGKASIDAVRVRGIKTPNTACAYPINSTSRRRHLSGPAQYTPLDCSVLPVSCLFFARTLGATMRSTKQSVGRWPMT
jgi:formate dehydrogenase assembly factor FdhD